MGCLCSIRWHCFKRGSLSLALQVVGCCLFLFKGLSCVVLIGTSVVSVCAFFHCHGSCYCAGLLFAWSIPGMGLMLYLGVLFFVSVCDMFGLSEVVLGWPWGLHAVWQALLVWDSPCLFVEGIWLTLGMFVMFDLGLSWVIWGLAEALESWLAYSL